MTDNTNNHDLEHILTDDDLDIIEPGDTAEEGGLTPESTITWSEAQDLVAQMNLDFQTRTFAVSKAMELCKSNKIAEVLKVAQTIEEYVTTGDVSPESVPQ